MYLYTNSAIPLSGNKFNKTTNNRGMLNLYHIYMM